MTIQQSMYRVYFIYLHLVALFSITCSFSASSTSSIPNKKATTTSRSPPPPIVYTIAGSDSGGGAGIQADLHAIKAMGCHGCSAITCLTAQNSVGVEKVHAPPASFLREQLDCLKRDLWPRAIKIGMLGTRELAVEVGEVLKQIKDEDKNVWVVLDPVMISTSGSKLLEDDAIGAMVDNVFPYADLLTPNKFEAEALLGRELHTPQDIEQAAKDLLKLGCKAVLIKGGHTLSESRTGENDVTADVAATLHYAQDYLLSSEDPPADDDVRLCDASMGVWLRARRWDSSNTHGTGCTLSSSIAAALALGEQRRSDQDNHPLEGATSSIGIVDACCLAKAYVSAGIERGVQLGHGPGPVMQTQFPSFHEHFPTITTDATSNTPSFRPMRPFIPAGRVGTETWASSDTESAVELGRILPIVGTVDWVETLATTPGIDDIQLRIKGENDPEVITEWAIQCQQICESNNVRLWINDNWKVALKVKCFGVHLGQEDLHRCIKDGGLERLHENGIALGISTHTYGELAAAIGVKPSYISLGPVYATSSKRVQFDPQGLDIVTKWRQLIPPSIPFMTIGGIGNVAAAKENREAGADSIAVISAVTTAENIPKTVSELNEAMT